jgi:predicted alpha/beta-hydrolase family hydrolase
MTDIDHLWDGPEDAARTIVLAHGAGAPMDSLALTHIAQGLGTAGFRVLRFNFPYMAERAIIGKKRPPDREPVLRPSWQAAVDLAGGPKGLIIGGRSMGGRIASMMADELDVAGLICLGYPFHPPGRPEKLRTEHLKELRTPTLILQGERDPFGTEAEVESFALSDKISIDWLTDGDHGFKPRKSSGVTLQQNLDAALARIVEFVGGLKA